MFAVADQHRLFYERGGVVDQIRQYLISITVAAIICSILPALSERKGTQASLVRLLCGIFLSITIVSPWLDIDVNGISGYLDGIKFDATGAVADGKAEANASRDAIIKTQTEAYILDKASSMQLDITVEVTLNDSDPPLPHTVLINGAASPYAKQTLQRMITADLGIPRENQRWI